MKIVTYLMFDSCPYADRPSAPEGPLNVTGVSQDSVTLAWQPPKDNGGAEITGYILEKREADQFRWSRVSSTLSSPRYAVTGLQDGRSYHFRVRAVNKYGESEPLETEAAVLVKSAFGKCDFLAHTCTACALNMYLFKARY